MHILNDPSFFLTNKTGAPQGEELGLMKPFQKVLVISLIIPSFRMEPIDRVLELRGWLLELSRSGIPLVALEEDMASPWERLQAGSESRPPMLNKENYVPWSSRLLRYAKSRPNGKLIHNSILNGPYVRRMISEPGDANHEVTVTETFHVQTDDELSNKELQ
nr:ribonuclease H-like domain-containing protein [Tanacetum cinerariifolium]